VDQIQTCTAIDDAQALKDLADTHVPKAKKNRAGAGYSPPAGGVRRAPLNPHKPASLSEAFPPAEARRRVERFAWHSSPKHDSPKHGSWLNMAESERAVLSNQCLDRCIPDPETLIKEIAAWEKDRTKHHVKADWQFTTADARIKLKYLYPTF
jgi:hypothetical protein